MEDFQSASTEGASPSPNDVGTTSASGVDAGQSTTETPVQPQVAPETPSDELSAGWSLDEQHVETASIPESDDDIETMLTDPALDPERTPGLVTSLREARKFAREKAAEANQAKAQLAQLEQFGGFDAAVEALPILNTLFTGQVDEQGQPTGDDSTLPFLGALHRASYPRFERLVNDVIEKYSDHAVTRLQELGKLPEASAPQRTGSVDPEILTATPDHLKQQYKDTPEQLRNEYDLMSEAMRNHLLERDLKLSQMDATQRQQEQNAWKANVEKAQKDGSEAISSLIGQYEAAQYKELAKWTPYGPEDATANSRLHKEIVEGAWQELLSDEKFGQMFIDAQSLLRDAPMRRLMQESLPAAQDERRGRGLAAQVSTRLGQLVAARVKERSSIYEDARKWREHQRQQSPERTEIPGSSSQTVNGARPNTLTKNGRISDEYTNSLIANIQRSRAQG